MQISNSVFPAEKFTYAELLHQKKKKDNLSRRFQKTREGSLDSSANWSKTVDKKTCEHYAKIEKKKL